MTIIFSKIHANYLLSSIKIVKNFGCLLAFLFGRGWDIWIWNWIWNWVWVKFGLNWKVYKIFLKNFRYYQNQRNKLQVTPWHSIGLIRSFDHYSYERIFWGRVKNYFENPLRRGRLWNRGQWPDSFDKNSQWCESALRHTGEWLLLSKLDINGKDIASFQPSFNGKMCKFEQILTKIAR